MSIATRPWLASPGEVRRTSVVSRESAGRPEAGMIAPERASWRARARREREEERGVGAGDEVEKVPVFFVEVVDVHLK